MKLTPKQRLQKIAEILENHDHWLLAEDDPVRQEPLYLRKIYLLATYNRQNVPAPERKT